MRNNNDGRSLPASHRDGQHRSGILFPHPSPDWDRWIRNQADFLGTDDPEPPHPLQDYPRAPQVGGRDFRGDFRAIGRQAFGRAATVAPYLQLNPPNCYAALLLDVDDWRRAQNAIASASVPLPTWQARDRNTGRGHMGYALAEPVHANRTSSLPALHYLAAIENTLQRVMGADPAFAQRALTRNPWRPSLFQKNTWHPRTFALRELIPLCGLLPRPRARAAAAGLKRNATLFRLCPHGSRGAGLDAPEGRPPGQHRPDPAGAQSPRRAPESRFHGRPPPGARTVRHRALRDALRASLEALEAPPRPDRRATLRARQTPRKHRRTGALDRGRREPCDLVPPA